MTARRKTRNTPTVLAVVLTLVVVGMLTLMLLPAVNLAGSTPPARPAPEAPTIQTPLGVLPVLLIVAVVAAVLIGALGVLGFVLGLGARTLEGYARRAAPPSQPAHVPAEPGQPRAAPAPAVAERRISRTGILLGVLFAVALGWMLWAIVTNAIWLTSFTFPLVTVQLGAPLALLALLVLSVVLVAGLGAALAGLFLLLDRLNRSPTPRGRR